MVSALLSIPVLDPGFSTRVLTIKGNVVVDLFDRFCCFLKSNDLLFEYLIYYELVMGNIIAKRIQMQI